MPGRLREAYARLRTLPIVGVVASRLVWATKGALGRPIVMAAAGPAAAPPVAWRAPPSAPDIRMQLALAAIQALGERIAALEAPPSAPPAPPPRATGPAPASVSVIVSTLDRADWLDRALTALAYQRHQALEVIVVAGPCQDGTRTILERHAARIRIAHCAIANLSASRNLGLTMARGDVVAFLDDDATPEPDWLERLIAPYADARVGGVGGHIRDHTGLAYQCKVMAADRFGCSVEVGELAQARLDPSGPDVQRYLSLTGTNSSFRRQALAAVGGFDEAYAYFLDETDLCLRLVEAGWRLTVAPDAEVHHAYAPSAQRRDDRAPQRLLDCATSTAYFVLRNAAPGQGLAAAADHLQAYAERLRHDTLWRRDHGVLDETETATLLAEIEMGVVGGVRAALEGPRRLARLSAEARPDLDWKGRRAPSLHLRPTLERLRLCLLSQGYPPPCEDRPLGGVAVWTQALAQALAQAGHEVTVITRTDEAPSVRFEACNGSGLWVHRIASRATGRAFSADPTMADLPASVAGPALAAAHEAARIDPRRRFDLIMGPLWDVEPMAMLSRAPCPVAVSLHTTYAQMGAFKPDWDDAYRRAHVNRLIAAERKLLARTELILTNSRAAAVDIGALLNLPDLAARAELIPHGLPDLAIGVSPIRRAAEVEILFVGRLELRKGIDVLLAAAPGLLSAAHEARLVIVGEEVSAEGRSSWSAEFQRAHAGQPWLERVVFTGPLSDAERLSRYAACDIVVVPSRYESFGLTALEAMIFAKPCVASDAGGLAEVVANGETGLLTPPSDAPALGEALLRLVRSTELRLRLGAAGRRRYEARFTAQAMAASVEAWVRERVKAPTRHAAE